VAAKRQGLYELRTRVTCNLPVNNSQEEKAFFAVLDYVSSLRHEQIGVGGYTHSVLRPAAFHGYWWPDGADEPVRDHIVVCTIDYLLASDDRELSKKISELKQTVRKWYRYYRCPQDEIWVVAHPILRQD
jgi:hypothetical protein